MPEKVGFWKRLEKSRKLKVLFFCVSMAILSAVYLLGANKIYRDYIVVEDDFSWVYQIEEVSSANGDLKIVGWAFELEKKSKNNKYEIMLRQVETGNTLYPQMEYQQREDVNEYFCCEYDYLNSGFCAVFEWSTEDSGSTYEILLHKIGNRSVFSTEMYYKNGEIFYADPTTFIPLMTDDTFIQEISTNGILRVYRPEAGAYVYQYDKELYWILESDNDYWLGNPLIRFEYDTSQVEMLPENRKEAGWGLENFWLESHEVLLDGQEGYRILKKKLPECPITRIWTGTLGLELDWRNDFRPWYEIN